MIEMEKKGWNKKKKKRTTSKIIKDKKGQKNQKVD